MRTVTLEAMQTAVTEKQAKFERYSKSAQRVWLFLIADGIPGAWGDILSDADLKRQAEAIAAASDFERVLLFRFARGINELFVKRPWYKRAWALLRRHIRAN